MSPRNSCTESGIDHPIGRRLVDCATADVAPYKSWLRQRSGLCDPVFAAWFQLDDRYQVLRQEFLAGPFSEPTVTEMVEKWGAQIESATKEASEAHGDAISPTTWQQAMDQLLHGVAFAREK